MDGFSKQLFLRASWFLCLLSVSALVPEYIDRDRAIVFAQDGGLVTPRTVQLEPSFARDPAKIVKVLNGGVEVKPGVPFLAGDEWFRSLSVVIKNLSPKKIVFARIQVNFPETGDGTQQHPKVGDQSSAGQLPENARYSGITGRKLEDPARDPILVGPGEELTIPVISRLGDDHFDGVKSMVESRQTLASVTTCLVGLTSFYFDDGTKWAWRVYYRPDPNRRGKYIVIPIEEFNGQPASNRDPSAH